MIARQLSLDEAAAEEARDRGIDRALANADPVYGERLLAAIVRLARSGQTFTSDDARALAGEPPAGQHPNIAGAIFMAAKRKGLIEFVAYGRSSRVVGHGNVVGLWRGKA